MAWTFDMASKSLSTEVRIEQPDGSYSQDN